MSEDFVVTPHRAKILSVLRRGDIEDVSGQATPKLKEHTGHRHTNSLSGVLGQMEKAGLVQRDVAGRRTYRIALTKKGRDLAELLADESAATRIEQLGTSGSGGAESQAKPKVWQDASVLDGAVDLDLLAGVLLKKALLATQAQEESAGAKEARAQLAELREELRAVRDEAIELRAQLKTMEHNNKVLTGQMDKVRKSPGTPINDLISKRERVELEKLMRALPTQRG